MIFPRRCGLLGFRRTFSVGISARVSLRSKLSFPGDRPDHVNTTRTLVGVHEQWVYGEAPFPKSYVYFENGLVKGWEFFENGK